MAQPRNHGKDRGDAAVGSSVIAFLVAGVLFMASVVAVLVTTRTSSDSQAASDAPESAAFQIQAKGLADLLLGSPGYAGLTEFGRATTVTGHSGKLSDADLVTRLGLLDPDSTEPGMMDFKKFQNLRLAPLAQDGTDQYVNYEEAAATLGLGSDLDFHIRSYPSLASAADMLADLSKRDENLRVAYVADGVTTSSPSSTSSTSSPTASLADGLTLGDLACTVDNGSPSSAPKALIISSLVTNGGDAATAFEGVFDLTFSKHDTESRKRNTGVIPVGAAQPISVQVGAIDSRNCKDLQASLKLYDSQNLLKETSKTFTTAAAPTLRPARALRLDTSSMVYADADPVVLDWRLSKDIKKDDVFYITVCPGVAVCDGEGTTLGLLHKIVVANKEEDRHPWTIDAKLLGLTSELPASMNMKGELYTARLYEGSVSSSSYRATQTILVTDAVTGPYDPAGSTGAPVATPGDYASSNAVEIEVKYLQDLMGKFCPTWFDHKEKTPLRADWWDADAVDWNTRCQSFKTDPAHQPKTGSQAHFGDVYPQSSLSKTIEDRLMDTSAAKTSSGSCKGAPRYDWTNVLVIGSNIDHNKMTSGDVKDCVQDWVLGGGTLIVLGSQEGKNEWLQSTFKVALESSSTGINVPDTAHPILHVPNELGFPAYKHAYSWRLKETGKFDSEAAFTRVVNEAGTEPNAILAVSDPGDFQGGSVILTGWTPYDLAQTGPGSLYEEGRNLLHNLLMLGYRDLYLDYGPALPEFSNVIPAVRGTQICHPEFDDPATTACENPIDLRMLVYVFPKVR